MGVCGSPETFKPVSFILSSVIVQTGSGDRRADKEKEYDDGMYEHFCLSNNINPQ